jgi:hypothetical protein
MKRIQSDPADGTIGRRLERARARGAGVLTLGLFPALIASGCSFAMVNRPKPKVQNSVCTDSYAWPVVDLVIAAAFSAGVVYRTMNGVSISSSGTTVRAGLALLTYSSFIYGSIHVDRCVTLRDNHVQSIEGNDTDPLSTEHARGLVTRALGPR